MSLFGKDPRYTMGAIRNAQILPVFFPSWTLRIYVSHPKDKTEEWKVPQRILTKLQLLGAHLTYVNTSDVKVKPVQWRYLVADDENVDYFLIRDSDSRLSDRDADTIKVWLESWQTFHCIRDHPKYSNISIVDGLWGAKSHNFRLLLGVSMLELLSANPKTLAEAVLHDKVLSSRLPSKMQTDNVTDLLQDVIWPLVQEHTMCHDSVSCYQWPSAYKFPSVRTEKKEYLGESFDQYGQTLNPEERQSLISAPGNCSDKEPLIKDMPAYIHLPEPGFRCNVLHISSSATSSIAQYIVQVTLVAIVSSVFLF